MKTAVKEHGYNLKFFEIALLIGLAVFLTSGALALRTQDELADKVVRLHVLANSDSGEDQALKLQVRDVVLERATAILEQAADRREAESRLRGQLLELERIAAEEIAAEGYDYPVTVNLENTDFPTKEYDGFTLPAGEYLALRGQRPLRCQLKLQKPPRRPCPRLRCALRRALLHHGQHGVPHPELQRLVLLRI